MTLFASLAYDNDDTYSRLDDPSEEMPHIIRPLMLDSPEFDQKSTIPLGRLEDAPQGRHMGIYSVMVLFISRTLGSGIFAASSAAYVSCGRSPFLYFLSWFFAYLLATSGLYIYLELGSLIPRSGGTKTFLEVIYDKPFMLVSVIFLIYAVLFGFALLGALIFGEYFLRSFDIPVTDTNSRVVGGVFVLIAGAFHSVSLNHGIMVQNFIGGLKILLLIIMSLTGLYVCFLPESVTGIEKQLHWSTFFNAKGDVSIASISSAIIMESFTLAGWNLSHANLNEVKDPVRTYKIAGPSSLAIIIIGYSIFNLCYLWALSDDELMDSGNLIGAILFEKVFGYHLGSKLLTISIVICTGGNIFVVVYSISRMTQESFREGFLPRSQFMASNRPFGTPMNSIILCVGLTGLCLWLIPSGNAYRYVVATEGYPVQMYTLAVAVGIFVLRKKYPGSRAPIRANSFGVIFVILFTSYLLVAPFVGQSNPPGSESWLPYPIVSFILLLCSGLYWFVQFKFLPWRKCYRLVPEHVVQDDGLSIKRWNKVPGRYFG